MRASGESDTHSPKATVPEDNSQTSALVTKLFELKNRSLQLEKEQRALRMQAIKEGELELARQFLDTPGELKDLAQFLWYDKPIVQLDGKPKVKAATIDQRFAKKFVLERVEGRTRRLTKSRADAIAERFDAIKPMIATKVKADLFDAARKGDQTVSDPKMVRELAIETAPWRYPLEEWATIFPDAALAGDHDFIKRIVDGFTEASPIRLHCWIIAFSWHGFEWRGLSKQVPPLKHWCDKAACEFVSWMSSDPISINAYKAYKKKLGLRREQPTLVAFAECKKDCLYCAH